MKNAHLREAAARDPTRNCGPDKLVYFRDQNQVWDEMFSPIIQYSIDDAPPRPRDDSSPRQRPLKVEAAVGCLARDSSGAWILGRAAALNAARTQSTSQAELHAAGATPLGDARYRLLGPGAFNPRGFEGDRVAVKGVLIRGSDEIRLNVTSLQPVGQHCE